MADVARLAGVSPAVVYSFLNGKFYGNGKGGSIGIAETTQARIVQAMDKLGFVPEDPASRVRAKRKLGGFLMMLSDSIADGVANPYFSRIFQGFSSEGSNEGRGVSLATFHREVDYVETPKALPMGIRQGLINKVLLAGDVNYSLIFALKREGCAVVYASRNLGAPDVPGVVPDYRKAADLAIRHLSELGHRRIALAAALHVHPQATFFKELTAGCAETWQALGHPEPPPQFVFPSHDRPDAGHYLDVLRKAVPGMTAIFCFDDFVAISLINAADNQGLSVPRDLSVIGCNDEARPFMQIPLTTIRIPKMELGRKAAALLDAAIERGPSNPPQSLVLPVEIRIRKTTAPLQS
ncbi:MAG: LacI family DNA-binding transcriptional regulator [Terrimicrobiaceae bacterium]